MPPTKNKKPKVPLSRIIREMWKPYKQLFPYVWAYKWRFIGGLVSGALAGVVSGGLGLVIKHVTSQVFPNGQDHIAGAVAAHADKAAKAAATPHIEAVVWTCALIPMVMIIRSVLTYLNGYWTAWVSLKVLNDIRIALFEKVIVQSMEFYNRTQSGQLISRVSNDARVAQNALTQISDDLIVQPFTVISAIAGLFYLDWRFTIISFLLFPICLIPITVFGKRVRRTGGAEEAGAGDMTVVLQEAFAGIRVVKALGREPYEIKSFVTASKMQFRDALSIRKAIEMVGPLIEAISAIGVGMALVYVWLSHITAGTFIGLMGGLFILYEPIKKLSRVHLMLQKAMSAVMHIFDLMHMDTAVKDAPNAPKLKRSRCGINFENVTFSYRADRPPALKNISLRIEPGKTYALVGESGAGKSTVLSLILRFYDPQEGAVLLDDIDLRSVTQDSLRRQIAIVTQDTFLFHTTILENIRYGRLNATDEEVYAAAEQAFAHEFIMEQPNGYLTVIGDKGCNLSGGQQQRVAIARALLRNAPILLLDEATSALDTGSEQKIQLALERLSAGRTVVAIAHRLSTILKADQIVAMDKGQIVEMGTHLELFEKGGHYRRLYDLQFNRQETEEFAVLG